jgi:hypothetical protein
MRIRDFILGKPGSESSVQYCPAQADPRDVWYALLSTYEQLLRINLLTNHITGSRTSDTHTLCAIVSARRLCGN